MGISPHAVTNNANSKLLQVKRIVDNVSLPTPERMRRIAALCDDFRAATAGATHDPFAAKRTCKRHPGIPDMGCADCRRDRA